MDLGRMRRSRGYAGVVRLGLVGFGLVHLVLAVLALEVAFGQDATASSLGALQSLARRPLGRYLVWIIGSSLLVLTVWQVSEATIGPPGLAPGRPVRRLASLGRSISYLALGLLALQVALNTTDSREKERGLSADVWVTDPGRVVLGGVGLCVVGVGLAQIVRGVRRRFVEDLTQTAGRPTMIFGVVGHVAKGLVLVSVGGLLLAAALTERTSRLGGVDQALAGMATEPFGTVLLVAIAGGLACFGLYCFVWSRHARV